MSTTAELTMDEELKDRNDLEDLELLHHPTMQPIAGVNLELYARIVRSISMMNHDLSMLTPMAVLHGVDPEAWAEARLGWNVRIATDDAVNFLFRELYRAN